MRAFQRFPIGSAVAAALGGLASDTGTGRVAEKAGRALAAMTTGFVVSLAALGLSVTSAAQSRSDGEVLVMQMVSVTGVLELAAQPAGGETALEIDSGAMGRYRIDARGLGAELVQHVGELVTVVALVSPPAAGGGRILRVERFTLHESSRGRDTATNLGG